MARMHAVVFCVGGDVGLRIGDPGLQPRIGRIGGDEGAQQAAEIGGAARGVFLRLRVAGVAAREARGEIGDEADRDAGKAVSTAPAAAYRA